jgi:hypothetical protein
MNERNQVTDTNDQQDEPVQVRPFAAVLQDINNGQIADRLARDVQEVVNAVREHGRKGSITLKFEVQPRRGNSNALNVTARVDTKLPAPEPVESVFFADRGGNLLRDDPQQLALPTLREVERPNPGTANIREVH